MARILLVDDEVTVLQSIGTLLKVENHEVVTCTEGQDACDKISSEDFDLLITDIRMAPVDGMEILKLAHDAKPHMPSIVISAYGSDNTVEQSKALGCCAYIRKPFRIEQVMDAVTNALGTSDASAE